MISFILIFFAAMFNAVMDRTKDVIQYNQSVFRFNYNASFWCDGYETPFIKHTKYKLNAWHLSKSLMLLCLLLNATQKLGYIDVALLGIEWILVFNLYYNKIFKA